LKLAAIDIGSNAARLLISNVTTDKKNAPSFTKLSFVRVPLRLGFDVFDSGNISQKKIELLLLTLQGFINIAKAYEVVALKACATSAMRDAKNSPEIIRLIKEKTDLDIEIISGSEEALLVFENHIAENLDKDSSYLYIDVGGGSTELTFFNNNELIFKDSFQIGTIRLLKEQVMDQTWDEMKNAIKSQAKNFKAIKAIGSGGNINKVFSLSKKKDGKPLPYELLRDYYKELSNVSMEDRVNIYKLKEDRADVIVPALKIYLSVMRWAGADQIYVPNIGLVDGIVHHLYSRQVNAK
jgi:exopolyphosphatase/guanosine-5'-triphosphate,3'-diphosphate pyrophosphatase